MTSLNLHHHLLETTHFPPQKLPCKLEDPAPKQHLIRKALNLSKQN